VLKLCVATALAAFLLSAGGAGATLPSGNLIRNPGAEEGSASSDGGAVINPPEWDSSPNATITSVTYGAPGFLTAAQGLALGGGRSFFAGGPPVTGGDSSSWALLQTDYFPAEVLGDVAGGAVQATLSGCLGGYGDQDDRVEIEADVFGDPQGRLVPFPTLTGPDARARGGLTDLLPQSATLKLPSSAKGVSLHVFFERTSGGGTYNDAYADNLALVLTPAGSAPPAPNCSAPPPGGGPQPGPGGPPPAPGPHTSGVAISRGSSTATLGPGRVRVSLICTSPETPCSGDLRLTASSLTLGSTTFRIAAGRKATVRVSLRRRAKARLERMSRRDLRRLLVTARVRIGTASGTFSLRLRR
jgi:hypothetical protein